MLQTATHTLAVLSRLSVCSLFLPVPLGSAVTDWPIACADIDGPVSRCGPEDTGSFSLFFGELHLGSSSHTVPSSPSQTRTRQKQLWDPSLRVTTEQSHRGLPEQPRVTPFAR